MNNAHPKKRSESDKTSLDKVVLIIEDEDGIRNALNKLLTRTGYTVIEASHGREGLEIMEGFGVDIVITDIFMPNMDGLEVIRSIRNKNPNLKVIAISGGGQMHLTECLRWAAAFGADKTLTKPIQHTELLESIAELARLT